MVKRVAFRKRLGRRRMGSTRFRSSMKKYKSRYSYGRKYNRFGYKRRYSNRKYKRSFYKKKRSYKRGYKKSFYKSSGRHLKIPTSLYSHKTFGSTVLSSLHATVTDFFVNSATFNPRELRVIEPYVSNHAHIDTLSTLNPTNLFTRSSAEMGIDSHTVNPPVKTRKTTLSFTGHHSSPITFFSLYNPLMTSYFATIELNRLIGMPVSQVQDYLEVSAQNFPVIVYSKDIPNNTISAQYVRMSSFTSAIWDPALQNAIDVDAIYSDNISKFVEAILRSFALAAPNQLIAKQVGLIDLDNRTVSFIDAVPDVTSPVTINNSFARIGLDYISIGMLNVAINPTGPNIGITDFRDNPFKSTLVCLSAADLSITNAFIKLVADIVYIGIEESRIHGNSSASILSTYLSEVVLKRNRPRIDVRVLDTLTELKVLRIKQLSVSKAIAYYPKSLTNAHWICVPPGSSAKIVTTFSRDYSGFMSLFKSAVNNSVLKRELTGVGMQLLRKLEPAYNLMN